MFKHGDVQVKGQWVEKVWNRVHVPFTQRRGRWLLALVWTS
jgi:hypothetical protein